jgi:ATP-dependent Clp protease ATP-binding subunit ClpC
MKMEEELHKRVVSQDGDHAVCQGRSPQSQRLKDPKRPTGCFMFAGPTGVGKTLAGQGLGRVHVR